MHYSIFLHQLLVGRCRYPKPQWATFVEGVQLISDISFDETECISSDILTNRVCLSETSYADYNDGDAYILRLEETGC